MMKETKKPIIIEFKPKSFVITPTPLSSTINAPKMAGMDARKE